VSKRTYNIEPEDTSFCRNPDSRPCKHETSTTKSIVNPGQHFKCYLYFTNICVLSPTESVHILIERENISAIEVIVAIPYNGVLNSFCKGLSLEKVVN